ncbi:hypothetical protein C819_00239 [Lachnospiraceae bacterium 10-1]|nr:hypothetical protein C819_00239 [Lachnospiraceae bacterium 10-1]
MKFVYGKNDWATRERGEENGYLLTNGLGGFSSGTMIGSNTRNDHAFFMACVEPPNHRYNMIHRLEEEIFFEGSSFHLSSQAYLDEELNEEGYQHLSAFYFEDYPKWIYQIDGVEIVKKIGIKQGENLIVVKYEIDNRKKVPVTFRITPHLQFVPKGEQPEKTQEFVLENNRISSKGHVLYFYTDGRVKKIQGKLVEDLYYAYDACDGRIKKGNTFVNHYIEKQVFPQTCARVEIVYSMEETKDSADQVIREAAEYRKNLVDASKMEHEAAKMLVKSADQFVAERKSTGGKTILAGFPFFEDWGRDTMIALAGCCISTRQFENVKSILRTFSVYCKDGLMPNLFPEGKNEPRYNTVDASLLFIQAVYLYYQKAQDISFVAEMWPVMKEIITCYRKGTLHGIGMDEDGLIYAGKGFDQVTWMDVRIGDILPTPRHGKPVEINAYWYNALCVMKELGEILKDREDYGSLSEKVKISFQEKFWNEEAGCLKDVLSGTDADNQIRCNQIWAVSMSFTMLSKEKEKQVVDTVFEKLYTPYGLRTLAKEDKEFHGVYGGEMLARDLAYHQGTVWVFPMGAYYLAYLKTRDYAKEAREKVEEQLKVLESAMREGCIGQLPEIYDGGNPTFSRGCFAQAWSVGEILRVYEALETK